MIFFYCPVCKDGLEAEPSAVGTRMACPTCKKEIEVPKEGVKIATVRKEGASAPPASGLPGLKFLLVVAGISGVVLLGLFMVGQVLPKGTAGGGPPCAACGGKGVKACVRCAGKKGENCRECQGSGFRKNVRDETETCFACGGKGRRDCDGCGGKGDYSCTPCYGTGSEGAKPPPSYDLIPEKKK